MPPGGSQLSGERFTATYTITGDPVEARARAVDIGYEQTVEFPADLVPAGPIRDQVVGQVVDIQQTGPSSAQAVLSYACEDAGGELTQLLNVLFGNTSIKPGIRLERIDLPPVLLAAYRGPRFGRLGLRELLGVPRRPLLCTALKPMGFSPQALAALAYQFALGGIDLIKDDHGLADQPFAPFKERVQACAEAVQAANAKTGFHCLYVANVTAPADQLEERAYIAKALGSGGLLVSPGLVGWDAMRSLAGDDRLSLPVLSHPALLGSFTASPESGISHFALYGQITRLAGADATIFPSWGGRFAFSREECVAIVRGSQEPMDTIRPIFPTPGGGITLERLGELKAVYGPDTIFLMGGGLHRHSPDLVANSRYFRELVEMM